MSPLSPNITRRNALLSASVVAAGLALPAPARAFADELLASSDVIDFLYIDCSTLTAGDTQNIVVSLKEGLTFQDASLQVHNSDTAEDLTLDLAGSTDVSLLFTFAPATVGEYVVSSLSLVTEDGQSLVDFSDCDGSYRSFTATSAIAAMSLEVEPTSDDSEPTLEVYSADEDGETIQLDSIEEGISSSAAETSATVTTMSMRSVSSKNLVVALDPGHVAVSSGAVGVNGTTEASCTWKIAQYCKAELETYQNVSVVLTVSQSEALSSSTELKVRVQRAVDAGADVLVSLHLNSTSEGGSSGTAYGAEVWVPYSADYNYETHVVGEALGNQILAELEKLGLSNRGTKVRPNDGHYTQYDYPDGTIGDYYGIIRYARESNLPAIIVEHAFINNGSDYYAYLSSDSKLQRLGAADATGIASYYGLSQVEGAVYRLYNPNSGDHHYTMDSNEYSTLGSIGWKQEGVAWISPDSSTTPVYRLYNPNSGDHHYTMDVHEYQTLGTIGWKQEGVAWYSDDAHGVTVYRLFNPNETVGTHHYTMDSNEYATLKILGWKQEGVAWYGMSVG
jgi:N-acetylmuramoyl-L-alanine amidase